VPNLPWWARVFHVELAVWIGIGSASVSKDLQGDWQDYKSFRERVSNGRTHAWHRHDAVCYQYALLPSSGAEQQMFCVRGIVNLADLGWLFMDHPSFNIAFVTRPQYV
jgi:hypothetical protein